MNKIVHFIVYSKAAAYIAALLYIVIWCSKSVLAGGITLWGSLGLLLSLVAGYLSVRVAREHSFNDTKGALPATLFFMGCAIAPQTSLVRSDVVHFILFIAACYILLCTYHRRSAMGSYFLAFALVGVQCLMAPSLLLTLPFLVLCGVFMESLHVRTFFAALWGLLLPYWVAFGVLFLTDRVSLIVPYLGQIQPSMLSGPAISDAPLRWMQLLWIFLLALPGSVMILLNRTVKLQANAGFRLLITSFVVLLVTVWLSPSCYSALLPCILLYSSLIGTVLFVGNGNRGKNIYLIVLLILWISFISQPIWINYTMH